MKSDHAVSQQRNHMHDRLGALQESISFIEVLGSTILSEDDDYFHLFRKKKNIVMTLEATMLQSISTKINF